MKKTLLLAVALLSTVLLPAQGVYQLWGMTSQGGSDNLGVVFSTTSDGNSFQIRHKFSISNPGWNPLYTQLRKFNGKFYGITENSIFEWDPITNVYTKKIDFDYQKGNFAQGSLTLYNGKFYGMTSNGGTAYNAVGVIFEWDPVTNIYIKKIDFDDSNGAVPTGSLQLYNCKFYGMTSGGGNFHSGVIFEWDPTTNVFTKKFDFNGWDYFGDYDNGGNPFGSLMLYGNSFYGMTSGGGAYSPPDFQGNSNIGGTIFKWSPITNNFTKIYDFWNTNGCNPFGDLTLKDGKLYGMTKNGGSIDKGVIFELDPATNIYTVKYNFNNADGASPSGNLTLKDDKFFGLTAFGGSNNSGVLFEWDPVANIFSKKFDLNESDGEHPYGSLAINEGSLYGMTNTGGSGYGVIFEWNLYSNVFSKKINFNHSEGTRGANLTFYKGKHYGMTSLGGSKNAGVIFEFDPSTNLYSKKFEFNESNGYYPLGNLTVYEGKFYGMTSAGGIHDGYYPYGEGVIFEWDPVTNVYVKKFDFNGIKGAIPEGGLTLYGGKFYGLTAGGGSNSDGVLFEWDPSTNALTKKFDFDNSTGSHPVGNLSLFAGKFYGSTSNGGSYSQTTDGSGTIFEWDPSTNTFTRKLDIIYGSHPAGTLVFDNKKFYGVTREGGTTNSGAIFEWNPINNKYTLKISFDNSIGNIGNRPIGNLTMSGGKFYGMTSAGNGSIFEWNPVTNIIRNKHSFDGINGADPGNNSLTLAPAPVAKGLPGSCISFPSITINNSNNNQWVSITDNEGNAVAEIKANGNNLGVVTTSMFINNTAVREDASKKLYLDRSITITPQFQPATAVDVRLYIKASEYLALKNAVNSNGQSAGIYSVGDIAVYKVSGGCSPAVSTLTNKSIAAAGTWEADYVFTTSITSFSSFYFAGKAAVCTAPVITQVHTNPNKLWPPNHQFKNVTVSYNITGTCTPITSWLTVSSNEPLTGTGCGDIAPDWIIVNNHQLKLRAERSGHGNGRIYTICINVKDAAGNIATQKTKVTVPHNQGCSNSKGIYNNEGYIDANGDYFDQWFECSVTPNPSNTSFNLQVATASNEKIEVLISDISGRVIKKITTQKDQQLHFGNDLQPGLYLVKVMQGSQLQIIKLVKQ